MRGSIRWQAAQIIQKSEAVQIGQSRHTAKELAKNRLAEAGLSATAGNLGREVGLFGYKYTRDVKSMLKRVAFFARENFGVRDLEKLNGLHFQKLAESLIEKGNISLETFKAYMSQMAKCENLLNGYAQATGSGKTYEIRPAIDEMRSLAKATLEKATSTSRAYQNPQALISTIANPLHSLGAEIQHSAGFRYYEMGKIDKDQLLGISTDPYTGKEKGIVRLDPHDTKGGKGRLGFMNPEGYSRLSVHIDMHGSFKIDSYKAYLASLEKAASHTNQDAQSSHGLRWNFAQQRYHELTAQGLCHEEALHAVSWSLGHERGNITLHYLGY